VPRTSEPLAKHLESLFDLTLDAFIVAGFDGYMKAANRALAQMLGYSHEQLLATPYLELVHPDDVASVEAALVELAAGNDLVGFECRLVCADGSARWFEWHTTARPEDGLVYGVGRDVTDRKMTSDELSALRRVATLVAEGKEPRELFAVVAQEVADVIDVPVVGIARYELDDTATTCASFSREGPLIAIGRPWSLEGTNTLRLVRDTSAAARIDDYSGLEGEIADFIRRVGLRSTVAVPIVVQGRLWGVIVVTSPERLPDGTEERLADFCELIATAIANAESREALKVLVAEKDALRRVATIVARESSPREVLGAVTEEAWHALDTEAVGLLRFESDGTATLVAQSETPWDPPPLGTRFTLDGENIIGQVLRTRQVVRVDDWTNATGQVAAMASTLGIRSAVATPVLVEGQLWGTMIAVTSQREPLPGDTESRIGEFTELVATAIANARARAEVERLADEQGALRRVATLVAEGVQPTEIFSAVSREVERVFAMDEAVDLATVVRFDPGPEFVLVGAAKIFEGLEIGSRWAPKELYVSTKVFRTGRSARVEESDLVSLGGEDGETLLQQALLSQVGSPIIVEGRVWGAITMNAKETLPPDTEDRLATFTELVATAIANADSREALAGLVDEQAALRRVATLVAQGVQPGAIFAAVSREAEGVVGSRMDASVKATVVRFEPGQECVLVGASKPIAGMPLGMRWQPHDLFVSSRVLRTGHPARVEEREVLSANEPDAETLRRQGYHSQVGAPIVVERRLWGAMTLSATETLPAGTEERLKKFTELVATAIANAENKSELGASRRRIVTASDETRRSIERDLHDGTQQRLVSLGLALRTAEATVPPDRPDLQADLSQIAAGLAGAVEDLQELSRGIHPAILSKGGLAPALRSLALRSAIPVQLDISSDVSIPQPIEVAAYFVASEALANATKHADASRVEISLTESQERLLLAIRDDGVGGADPARGSGLVGLTDRVEALGGSIEIRSPRGEGTAIVADLPVETEPATDPEKTAA
jgi:PAS domain S-box-containing protein